MWPQVHGQQVPRAAAPSQHDEPDGARGIAPHPPTSIHEPDESVVESMDAFGLSARWLAVGSRYIISIHWRTSLGVGANGESSPSWLPTRSM